MINHIERRLPVSEWNLPGRINYGDRIVCIGCQEVVSYPLGNCNCNEWNHYHDRESIAKQTKRDEMSMKSIRRIISFLVTSVVFIYAVIRAFIVIAFLVSKYLIMRYILWQIKQLNKTHDRLIKG